MDAKWFIAISTIIICNIRHIQSAKVEKIDKIFIFENRQKMTKSGTQGSIGRAKFSNFDFDHFFSRIEPFWVILSKKNFFRKNCRKWLSLEASKHCKGSVIQKSQKKVPNVGFNHLFSRIIFSKFFRRIIQYGHFWPI